ncbi:gamma-glutamyl-gamma-aminobutyrate hydrolase family protein [Streptomyces sp. NPDC005963]|uniref:gamma-glutamyl-gamma-aminobutyrate hydrolase family protein n=1 Tax=Streptomyces sp. NPDC005963 TaxID=3156721 RepID=UPI0033C259BD
MPHPLIGITTYLDPAAWGVWRRPAALLPADYPALVQRAGGVALMLPPDPDPRAAPAAVARLDGLILAGGADVAPEHYGAAPDPRTGPPAHERDHWELALIDAARAAAIPILGICRGMQLLNVALGGTLLQHLDGHIEAEGVFGSHPVTPVPGTLYASIVPETTHVPTYHHQAVARLASRLRASAHAEDGTVEAVEPAFPGDGWLLGVQWHPEVGRDLRVVRALVSAASRTEPALSSSSTPTAPAPARSDAGRAARRPATPVGAPPPPPVP